MRCKYHFFCAITVVLSIILPARSSNYKVTAATPLVCAFAFATLLLMKSKKANWLALAPNSYTKRLARYEPKMARR